MNKAELVKIISKKAAVPEASAKEIFDLFLQKIAIELQPGESAMFSNIGYFHLRKGKIKKEDKDTDAEKIEYLDIIIFSSSLKLNIKSPDNLVFSVPESMDTEQDNLDAHFSLSADKPVLTDLDKHNTLSSDSIEIDTNKILKRKVESLMVNLQKEQRSQSDIEILLVDIKTIDEDQFELELDEDSKRKNSKKIAGNSIHSSEKLISRAWDFGNDLTKQIKEEPISAADEEKKDTKAKDEISGWDFGKRFWGGSPPLAMNNKIELDKIESQESADEKIDTENENESAEEKTKEIEVNDLEIEMEDFQVSNKVEKIGKFERVRSVTSSIKDDASLEEVKGFEKFLDENIDNEDEEIDYDNEFKKISSKAEKFRSQETKKSLKETIVVKEKKDSSKKEIKLNRTEALRKHRRETRQSSATKFLTIAAIFIIITGLVYLFMKDSGTTEVVEEILPPIERIDNATYIERTYAIPVTYPYSKPEAEIKVIGISLTDAKEVKPEEIIMDKLPSKKELKTKPPVKKAVTEEKTKINSLVKKPSGNPVQAAYNIYRYDNIYIVQVAAFKKQRSAEKEASKHIAKGYNAFLEEAIIDGVKWYRVRVGNFNTLSKAKQFRKLNN